MTNTNAGLGGDYPISWDEFVGQEQAKRQLMTACRSAKMRGVALDHVLLASGTPGIGKTSLALLAAREMGREAKVVSGKIPANLARIALADLMDGDVLIYDEIHMAVAGGKANAEWLLHLLQDGVIMGPTGPEQQPKITVIGATTDAGKLPEPLLQRFMLKPVLEEYDRDEAALIALTMATRSFGELPLPSEENLYAIADASCHNPRTMKAILINVRDIALTTDGDTRQGDTYPLDEALTWLGLTHDGLDIMAQRYLQILLTDFSGGAGKAALADRLQEPGGIDLCERVLMQKGLVAKTRLGRVLTGTGIKRAKALIEEAA